MTINQRLITSLILLFNLASLSTVNATPLQTRTPQDATQGSLWLQDEQHTRYQPAPILDTSVEMDISGMLARVKVRQTFHNPGSAWAEGIYVFPLPENAAVDHLRMHIGERIIEGQIKEKEEAKKTYQKAKQEGKRASLVEQERPNIFTSSLANIGPNESITVEIEYQQTVRYIDGAFRLRFPTVVGPRYIPGQVPGVEQQVNAFSGSGWARGTHQVPDAARITPPVQHPDHGSINPVMITIHLDAGIPLADVSSPYHGINAQAAADGSYRIALAEGAVPADRDFELVWRPQEQSLPNAAWFVQHKEQEQYGLLMLVPPQQLAAHAGISREVVFVIDTSGSMHGDSIKQARKALLLALDRLGDQDRFNIIEFNHSASRLFSTSRAADVNNLAIARNFVTRLNADGGTEMLPALQMALQSNEQHAGVRQVVFLTDGSVGNETQLFDVIRKQLHNSRLFTIGIGSAPNSWFMRKAAEYGRGTFTYIGKTTEVMDKMSLLFRKLEHPALTDIRLELPDNVSLDMLPQRIPDLYIGEPLLLAFHAGRMPEWLSLSGMIGDTPWNTRVSLNGGLQGQALAPEWGRRKIAQLMTQLHDAGNDRERQALRKQAVDTALAHHLVSKYTSLVAVDVTPARAPAEALEQHAMKTNLPKGWSHPHVFGTSQTATPAQLQLLIGLLLLLLAALTHRHLRKQPC